MKILITGATGLVGRAAATALFEAGHELTVLGRNARKLPDRLGLPCRAFDWEAADGKTPPEEAYQGVEAIINLAGEPIAEGRWTKEKKERIYRSRVDGTSALVQGLQSAVAKGLAPPKTFISASAIGVYGDRGNEPLTEASLPGYFERDFLCRVCRDWEAAAKKHSVKGMRTILLRTGVVLSAEGGYLSALLPLFRRGLGGAVGSGKQWISWIHIEDMVAALLHLINHKRVHGPVNLVAPKPVTNREMSRQLGWALGLPALVPAPALALKLVLREKAQLALFSQRVIPEALTESGYQFRFSELHGALEDLVSAERLSASQWVPRPVEEVFAFFSDEKNLETLTPPWLGFHVVGKSTQTLGAGTLIDYQLKLRGVPVRWRSKIDVWEPNRRFSDVQVRGPYAVWEHAHTFKPVQGGTLIGDSVRFKVPFGRFGDAVAGWYVRKDVQKIFEYRRTMIRKLFAA